jgi:hypothetical protein
LVKQNQPLLHARVRALPRRQVPADSTTRETGHGRTETRALKTAHAGRLGFPGARQAIKITRWRKDTATGKTSRETAYAVTSLTSADATSQDLARLVREHWSIEAHHHIPPGRDIRRRHRHQPDRQLARQPGYHPRRRHRGHRGRRLPAHPRRPPRSRHAPPKPSASTASIRQMRTFTEHAGAQQSTLTD